MVIEIEFSPLSSKSSSFSPPPPEPFILVNSERDGRELCEQSKPIAPARFASGAPSN